MASLTISGFLNGVSDLEMHDPSNGRKIVSFDSGGQRWEFRTAESDFVHGELATGGHLKEGQSKLVVRIIGTSMASFVSRRDAVLAVFRQWDYTFTYTVDGSTIATLEQCRPADVELLGVGGERAGGLNKFGLMARQQEYGFTFMHKPL